MKNARGFSLTEVIVSLGLVAMAGVLVITILTSYRKAQWKNDTVTSMTRLREGLMSAIANQESWDITRKNNPAMACALKYPSTCAPGAAQAITLYGSDGNVLFGSDTRNPSSGFTEQGISCKGFSASGSPRCPVRVEASWEVACAGAADCKYPEELVSLKFSYAPGAADEKGPFNPSRFNLTRFSRRSFGENYSPVVNCARAGGKVFIGAERTAADGDGNRYKADADGCVSLLAFKGPTGNRGPMGATGPQGPQGPRGPAGGTSSGTLTQNNTTNSGGSSNTSSQTLPVCTAHPDLCQAYRDILGREPDQAGAEYWASGLESGQASMSSIVANFKQVAAGVTYTYTDANGNPANFTAQTNEILTRNQLSTDYETSCSGGADCSATSAAAYQEIATMIDNFCTTPGNKCAAVPPP